MKTSIFYLSIFLILFTNLQPVQAQINRTLETKVADILAQLPTKNLEHSDKLMQEIVELNQEGVLQFCDYLVPLGTGDDTQARFAIQSLAVFTGKDLTSSANKMVEEALLTALEKQEDTEIKAFLIRRLQFCGTNISVSNLSNYLTNKDLYKPAIATLTTIGTSEASAAIFKTTQDASPEMQPEFIQALGTLKYAEAEEFLEKATSSTSALTQQKAYWSLAEIASPNSYKILSDASKKNNYSAENTNAVNAFIHYADRLSEHGNTTLSNKAANEILKNTSAKNQLHFRLGAIQILSKNTRDTFTNTLVKESKNPDIKYTAAILEIASKNLSAEDVSKWVKAYKKADVETKTQFIRLLEQRKEPEILENCLQSALKSSDKNNRIAAIKALQFQEKSLALPLLFENLKKENSLEEYQAIEETLLRTCTTGDIEVLTTNISQLNDSGKIVLINVLAARNATDQFDTIVHQKTGDNDAITKAVYTALPSVSTSENLLALFTLLEESENVENIKNVQNAITGLIDNSTAESSKVVLEAFNNTKNKEKITPILPALQSEEALQLVVEELNSSDENRQLKALEALGDWQNSDALPYLFETASANNMSDLHKKGFDLYVSQVIDSEETDDQKLLLLQKIMPFASSNQEKMKVIYACRNVKTFLSLIYVGEYLDDEVLKTAASNTAISIALPSPGKDNGLTGDKVKAILSKSIDNLTGPDSIYSKIDVKEYVENLSSETGFVSIFNGKDLSGWKGLVENPIARSKMSEKQLAAKQKKANEEMRQDWVINEGILTFVGEGYKNICTEKNYGDFEMVLNWKIGPKGDSGIYLRGTPQVQIWDTALTEVGAQVGSGGLYNNQKNESKPLQVADNPVNDWNTFRIKMVGERVTVYLNGVLVTDNVPLENYWDKNQSIFPKDAIELQAHGENVQFKNIYVREISSGADLLSAEEKKDGFTSLFNGKDLDHWIGNKTDYLVENNQIMVQPKQGGHGNLYTSEEYSNFIFRFEFQLSPGANNGLGIHCPLEGDAAYVGKELQILDDTAAIYATLKDYQYHGSVYGIIPAKRGFLNPVGEWNMQEVIVKGDHIKITLNGTVILDGNLKEATKNGTVDGQDHPGLQRSKGHIAFLGHGSELQFRNIRIKVLP